jgi:hypothetical protein
VARWLLLPRQEYFMMQNVMHHLTTRLFWDKKVKIALLALATFIAMC